MAEFEVEVHGELGALKATIQVRAMGRDKAQARKDAEQQLKLCPLTFEGHPVTDFEFNGIVEEK